jgi:hypothetical protein
VPRSQFFRCGTKQKQHKKNSTETLLDLQPVTCDNLKLCFLQVTASLRHDELTPFTAQVIFISKQALAAKQH